MKQILYCEDDLNIRSTIVNYKMKDDVLDCQVIEASGVREGLSKLTGINMNHFDPTSIDQLLNAIKAGNPNYDLLRLVLTDGELIDPEINGKKNAFTGWDLAYVLRETGYKGKIGYLGTSLVPENKKHLFDGFFNKLDLNAYNQYLQQI